MFPVQWRPFFEGPFQFCGSEIPEPDRSQEHCPAVTHSTTGNTELEHLFDFDLQAAPVIPDK